MGSIEALQKRVHRAKGPLKSLKKLSKVKSLSKLALFKRGHEISGKSSKAGFGCHSSRFIEKMAFRRGLAPTAKKHGFISFGPDVAAFGPNPGGDVGPGVCVGVCLLVCLCVHC